MTSTNDTGFFGHPKGLSTLFFTEMWERFSYYGMRALLVLFMTASVTSGGLGFTVDSAAAIYAMYTSMVYLVAVPGGWLADNFLGQRRSVFIGGVIIMLGHIALALHGLAFFYGGLALVVIGTGFLKPNISVIVGQLYAPEDERRDAGFSIFYMGINIGAFTAPLVCGWLAQGEGFKAMLEGWGMDPNHSWHWGFGAAAVGMGLGLVQYILTGKNLGDAGMKPTELSDEERGRKRKVLYVVGGAVLAAIVGLWAFDSTATYYERLDYRSTAEGLILEGHDAEAAEGSEAFAFGDGKAVAVGDLQGVIGQDAEKALRTRYFEQTMTAGEASGTLDDVYLRIPAERVQWDGTEPGEAELDGEFVRVGTVAYEVRDGQVALRGTLVVNDQISGAFGSYTQAQLEDGIEGGGEDDANAAEFDKQLESLVEPLGSALLAKAVEDGVEGSLADQAIKVGGLNEKNLKEGFTYFLLALVVGFFVVLFAAGNWTAGERARLITIFVLFLGASIFWGLFEQAGSTLTLFAERNTSNAIFGWQFPSSWWQSANAAFIILLAPFFAWLWVKLGKRNPSYPFKFGVGLLFAGLGFLVLVGGATLADGGQLVSPMWLFLVYLLHTIGELCLSPVGLSSMTKLAPAAVMSLMMGVWFLAASVGNFMAGSVAGFYEDFELPTLFTVVGLTGVVMAALMFLLVIPIKKMMQQSEGETAED